MRFERLVSSIYIRNKYININIPFVLRLFNVLSFFSSLSLSFLFFSLFFFFPCSHFSSSSFHRWPKFHFCVFFERCPRRDAVISLLLRRLHRHPSLLRCLLFMIIFHYYLFEWWWWKKCRFIITIPLFLSFFLFFSFLYFCQHLCEILSKGFAPSHGARITGVSSLGAPRPERPAAGGGPRVAAAKSIYHRPVAGVLSDGRRRCHGRGGGLGRRWLSHRIFSIILSPIQYSIE